MKYDSHRQNEGRMVPNPTAVNIIKEGGSLSIRDKIYRSDIFDIKEVLNRAL